MASQEQPSKAKPHRNAMTARASAIRDGLGLTDREMDLSRSQTWLRRRIFSTFSHVKPNRWFALQEIDRLQPMTQWAKDIYNSEINTGHNSKNFPNLNFPLF